MSTMSTQSYNEEICWRAERIDELELLRQKFAGGELEEVEAEIAKHEAQIRKIQRCAYLVIVESQIEDLAMHPWIEGRDEKLAAARLERKAATQDCIDHGDFTRGAKS